MVEYVFIKYRKGVLKVKCSNAEGNLPDLYVVGLAEEEYVNGLKRHMEYEAAWASYYERDELLRKSYADLFLDNFGLLCQNHREILATPEFSNIWYPIPLFGCKFGASGGTLGDAIKLWLSDPKYNGKTRNTCNGITQLSSHNSYPKVHSIRLPSESPVRDKLVKPAHISHLLSHIGALSEAKAARLLTYFNPIPKPTISDFDIYIPFRIWTEGFAQAATKAGLPFSYLPKRFQNSSHSKPDNIGL